MQRKEGKQLVKAAVSVSLLFNLMFNLVWLVMTFGCLPWIWDLEKERKSTARSCQLEECHFAGDCSAHTHCKLPRGIMNETRMKDLEQVKIRPHNNMLGVQSCALWSTNRGILFSSKEFCNISICSTWTWRENYTVFFLLPLWKLKTRFLCLYFWFDVHWFWALDWDLASGLSIFAVGWSEQSCTWTSLISRDHSSSFSIR